jgi:hypothetical protein
MYSPASPSYTHGPAAYGRPDTSYGIPRPPAYGTPVLYRPRDTYTPRDSYSPLGPPGTLAALVSSDHGGFHPDDFLDPAREAPAEGHDDSRILGLAREAFQATTGARLDDLDLRIRLCSQDELRKHHGPGWSPGIQGFSINRGTRGTSEVFVRRDTLDRLLLTLGHELGHILSPTLPDARDEEAKAFAFSIAWMQAIRKHDIAGLAGTVTNPLRPAENGLHDIGLDFVLTHVVRGEDPLTVFRMLARQELSVIMKPELIILED